MDEYIYGVARIRALESFLFTDDDINHLLETDDYDSALQFLRDKGWGTGQLEETLEDIIKIEQDKTKKIIEEIVEDKKDLAILVVEDRFHNLKAAIKKVCTDAKVTDDSIYVSGGIDPRELEDIIRKSEYDRLPSDMVETARTATETLLTSGDGQLCDVIVDKALLKRIKEIGQNSDNSLIKDYADIKVGMANIKIALRTAASQKDASFARNAMEPCTYVNVGELIDATSRGEDAVIEYLATVGLDDIADACKKSKSYFECVLDNKVIDKIKTQKYESFSIGPILAYSIARDNEIKTVKIILSGKLNGFDKDFIKERARIMYA